MKKIIRGIRIADASVSGYRRIRARDEIQHFLQRAIATGKILNLGRIFTGLGEHVDAQAETNAALAELLRKLRESPYNPGHALHAKRLSGVLDLGTRFLVDLKALRDGLLDEPRAARTGDFTGSSRAKQLVAVTPESRAYMEDLNNRAREFHARQAAPSLTRATGDSGSTTAVRDQLAIAARAPDMRSKIEALNRAANAFWTRA